MKRVSQRELAFVMFFSGSVVVMMDFQGYESPSAITIWPKTCPTYITYKKLSDGVITSDDRPMTTAEMNRIRS